MKKLSKAFMFDTSSINQIAASSSDELLIYLSKDNGFEYYFTEIQSIEASGNISNRQTEVSASLVKRNDAEFMANLFRIMSKLQTKYVGQIATLRPNKWKLDGTFELLPECEQKVELMFDDILNNNDYQHYNDAMLALTAIINGCTLVTNDKRLYKKINKYYPERAIKYKDFMSLLQNGD